MRDVAENFDAKQLDQSLTWTDPHGEEKAIIAMDERELKLIFTYLLSAEVAVRFRTMYALQERFGIRQIPTDMPMDEMRQKAADVSLDLVRDMEASDCEGMKPEVYCIIWMLDKPLVQAMMLRLAGIVQEQAMGDFKVPDSLPENFH